MRLIRGFLSALALVLPAITVPIEKDVPKTPTRYIVKLHPHAVRSSFLEATNTSTIYEYDLINGFAGEPALQHLR
ncbi:hypothetical protein H0H93_007833, partial [Arthromyces matolae]